MRVIINGEILKPLQGCLTEIEYKMAKQWAKAFMRMNRQKNIKLKSEKNK